jgi:hypothetical protein
MAARSPLVRARPAGEVELVQRFLGWEVEVDSPVFDPSILTLMDFRPGDEGAVCFMYVLPFSPTRALLEHTTIGIGGPAAAERRVALRRNSANGRAPVNGGRCARSAASFR